MIDVRQATLDDLSALVALYREAQQWLAARGLQQWQPAPDDTGELLARVSLNLEKAIERGTCFVVDDGKTITGTITVDDYADPEFWQPSDEPGDALYVHRMIVSRNSRGTGLGAGLLDWAEHQAMQQGKRWLRLDAWQTNTDLHRYYERQGMMLVRLLSFNHRGSGALFQRPVRMD